MTGREKLQYCYELAFYPPRLNEVWRRIKSGCVHDPEELGEAVGTQPQKAPDGI